MKKAIVLVSNDLSSDPRVDRSCNVLINLGFAVSLVGRKKRNSPQLQARKYKTVRLSLLFEKGFLFYASMNLRFFFYLLFSKAHLIVANDLDTLLPAWLISRLKNIPLVYDTHEYFTGVPELVNRPSIRKFWKKLEIFLFPKIQTVITVNSSVAELYEKEYKKKLLVVRNIPDLQDEIAEEKRIKLKQNLEIEADEKIVLYQGALNIDRGIEELIDACEYLPENVILLIVGDGDIGELLKEKAKKYGRRIRFTGRVDFENLHQYTSIADAGVSIEKDTNINYRLCLPNKLFSYIHAKVPVLVSRLPEMAKILEQYNIGLFIENHQPQHIADKLQHLLYSEKDRIVWKSELARAASELNWDNEKKILEEVFRKYV